MSAVGVVRALKAEYERQRDSAVRWGLALTLLTGGMLIAYHGFYRQEWLASAGGAVLCLAVYRWSSALVYRKRARQLQRIIDREGL